MDEKISPIKSTAMVSLITAACLLGDSMLYIVLPLYWREFGLEALWQVGILLSANRMVRLPFNPAAIWLFANVGQRKCVILSIALAFLTTLSYSLLTGFWMLFLVRCVWGMAWSLLRLGAYFSILQFAPVNERGRHMGVYNGVFRLGSLFGMMGGAFIAEFADPLSAGTFFSGIAFLSLPLAFKYVSDTPFKSEGQRVFDSVKIMFSEKLVSILVLTAFLSAFVYQGLFTSMLSYLTGYNDIKIGFLAALGFGAASVSGLLQAVRWLWEPYLAPKIGTLSDGAWGRRHMLIGFSVMAAVMFFFVSYKMDAYLWLALVLLIQLAGTGITTLVDATGADVASGNANAPAVLGAHSFSIDLGSAVGPLIGYFLNSYSGIHVPFAISGLCLLLIAFMWIQMKNTVVR